MEEDLEIVKFGMHRVSGFSTDYEIRVSRLKLGREIGTRITMDLGIWEFILLVEAWVGDAIVFFVFLLIRKRVMLFLLKKINHMRLCLFFVFIFICSKYYKTSKILLSEKNFKNLHIKKYIISKKGYNYNNSCIWFSQWSLVQ